jgi:hypothetical protein
LPVRAIHHQLQWKEEREGGEEGREEGGEEGGEGRGEGRGRERRREGREEGGKEWMKMKSVVTLHLLTPAAGLDCERIH